MTLLAFFDPVLTSLRSSSAGTIAKQDEWQRRVAEFVASAENTETRTAVFAVRIDGFHDLLCRHGEACARQVHTLLGRRLSATLRRADLITADAIDGFLICLQAQKLLDLETCIQMAGRLQRTGEEPYLLEETQVFLSISIGFCMSGRQVQQASGTEENLAIVESAKLALASATNVGPSGIRAFSDDISPRRNSRLTSKQSALAALENGEIVPFFQPQISTDTGQVSGFEVLARWIKPGSEPLLPSHFLSDINQAGAMERLCETMIYHSFTALRAWDHSNVFVPQVGINFSSAELSDPNLVDRITWELDRFGLAPERLCVEVLETVIAHSPDDVITRNLRALSKAGCQIDLDDFGTGHASISSLRKFDLHRIKIDRSFVTKADRDPEQQRMIAAILTMAEQLGLETLAEGVETVGEHSLLAQMGCTHVQGFGIARPMPFDKVIDWMSEHNRKLGIIPQIGKAGS